MPTDAERVVEALRTRDDMDRCVHCGDQWKSHADHPDFNYDDYEDCNCKACRSRRGEHAPCPGFWPVTGD